MTHPENVQTIAPRRRDVAALVEEYAACWRQTLDSVSFPRPDSYLEFVDQDSQPELRALLESVDDQYRRMLVEADADGTKPNWADATVIGPPPETPAIAAAPGDGAGDDVHAPTLLTPPPQDMSFGATADFAAAKQSATPVKMGSAAKPATDAGRNARTVIGQVSDEAEADVSWDEKSSPATKKPAGRLPRLPKVPGYEILGVLGRGGMGVVYRARQTGLNRIVALKMILAGDHAAPEHVARFKIEAEAVAQLQHPNIVQIFDINTVDGLPYFSLEFVDGRSLEEERGGKPVPPERAARMVVTLARAMHYAHQRGIVHRDLKPANVLLTSDGVPKVTDFGLVKRVEADSSETRTGTIVGTPSYMAPEQAWGKTNIGPAADVYALGAILYTLVTGRPPFLGPTPLETIMQLRQEEPVPPSRLQSNLPRDLETICLKALQKSPDSRYENADALADDLERFLEGAPILARPVGRAERMWRWGRRNPALAASGGAALLLALCLMIGGPVAAAMIYEQKEQAVSAQKRADNNARQAAANAREAKAAAELARTNEQLATRNAEAARQQRTLSLTALNELAERAQEELKEIPGTQDLRQRLLLRAMSGLNQISEAEGAELFRDTIMGRSHRMMGDLLLQSELAQQALEQYQKAHEVVIELMRSADPSKPHVPHLNFAISYSGMGKATQRLGNAPEARNYFLKALHERQTAVPLAPDKLFAEQQLALSYGDLISVHLDLGQPDEAVEYQRLGMELRRKWMENAPDNVPAMREYAGAQADLARIYLDLGRLPESRDQYTAALETLEKVAKADGRSIATRGNMALFQGQRGAAWLFADDAEKARTEYSEAAKVLEQVSAEDPDRADLRRMLAKTYYGLATACLEAGDEAAAQKHFAECAEIRRTLAEREPSDLTLKTDLMLALARTGDHAAASRLGEEVEKGAPADPSLLYFVAGGYALNAAASRAAGAGDQVADGYAAKAVTVLARAIEHGYRGVALMRMDPDLDPIRELPEFQKLISGLEERLAQPADTRVSSAASAPQTAR